MERLLIDDQGAAFLERPTESTIHDLLRAVAKRRSILRAIGDPEEELSYAELVRRVDVYAKALLAHGVGRGDRVAMLAPPGKDFLIVLHAATSIGAIWLGVNPRYQQRDFEYVLGNSDPAVLIVGHVRASCCLARCRDCRRASAIPGSWLCFC